MGHIHKYAMNCCKNKAQILLLLSSNCHICCWTIIVHRPYTGIKDSILKMCVLLEWLWGSTWAWHHCAPTYTKALTMTVSPKTHRSEKSTAAYFRLHLQLLTSRRRCSQLINKRWCIPSQAANVGGVLHCFYSKLNWLLINVTTQNVKLKKIKIILNAEMQLQYLSGASLCFLLEMKKRCLCTLFYLSHIRTDVRKKN